MNIIVGSHVWVEDPEDAWIDGQVTDISGKNATIITSMDKTVKLFSFFFFFFVVHSKNMGAGKTEHEIRFF